MREDYERAVRDMVEEGEGRRKAEERVGELEEEGRRREEEAGGREVRLEMVRAELGEAKAVAELLRGQVERMRAEGEEEEQRRTGGRGGSREEGGEGEGGEKEGGERGREGVGRGVGGVLVDVEVSVLRRRVQRLELELEDSRAEVERGRRLREEQARVVEDVRQHVEAMAGGWRVEGGEEEEGCEVGGRRVQEGEGGGEGDEEGRVVGLEVVLLKERLVCERLARWRNERRLLVAALLWLLSLFAVSTAALAVV